MVRSEMCAELASVRFVVEPSTSVCDECVALGDQWVHLRMCLECGRVGCCDDSKNRHARGHYVSSGHPVIRGIEFGERWIYCFDHDGLRNL